MNRILNKIDEIYHNASHKVKPFMFINGSSGMGKTQLAFALNGKRPYYYWAINYKYQNIYENFHQLRDSFLNQLNKDKAYYYQNSHEEWDFRSTDSEFYQQKLWIFGFILELVKYAIASEQNNMIEFSKEKHLSLSPCFAKDVLSAVNENKQHAPFFILDELQSKNNHEKNLYDLAFMRNVFRVCGLVVIVMGTDTVITNICDSGSASRAVDSKEWMYLISTFPDFKLSLSSKSLQNWEQLVKKYPFLKILLNHSRSLFSTLLVKYCIKNFESIIKSTEMSKVFDNILDHIAFKVRSDKKLLENDESLRGQLCAITLVQFDTEEHRSKRTKGSACYIHRHFVAC